MLNIAGRGPSSVARSLPVLSTYSTCIRPLHTRNLHFCLSPKSPRTPKFFRSSLAWRQRIATRAALEDEALEEEIDQEISSQTPPSDHHGPVTRFEDLAERGMVCQTIVDTITKSMGLETMTEVQSLTISQSLGGQDM